MMATSTITTETSLVPTGLFPFFKLPAELRDEVYALVLTSPIHKAPHPRCKHNSLRLSPAILRVSRRVHDECVHHLYSTSFCAHPSLLTSLPYHSHPAYPVLASRYVSFIRHWHISVRLDVDPNWSKDEITSAFSGADSLEVEVWEASYRGGDLLVLERFCEVRGVKKAIVAGSLPEDMASWLMARMQSGADGEVAKWAGKSWNAWEHDR